MIISNFNTSNLQKTTVRLKNSTKNFSTLLVRDIFDHLDYLVDLEDHLSNIVFQIKSETYQPSKPVFLDSPKSKGISRPTAILGIEDSIIYRFCIEEIQNELFGQMDRNLARGGMKITAVRNEEGETFYEKWFKDWQDHNSSIEKGLKYKDYLVTTDVASYFENINILLLKDLVRSKVKGKDNVINLLFYFIESTKNRNNFEVNTQVGLLQEDIDCSRILAYFFLAPHDSEMKSFCAANNAEFYRFVDDMSILVKTEALGRKALKVLTCSLRKIGLLSSLEKTSILSSESALLELFTEENKVLDDFQNRILTNLELKTSISGVEEELISYYQVLSSEKSQHKNWIKILKRFYTLFSYLRSDYLLDSIIEHLILYPTFFVGKSKIAKYLNICDSSPKALLVLNKLIDYLYSEENLYQAVETGLLEAFLSLSEVKIDGKTKSKLSKLGKDVFFRRGVNPQTEYARALACLIVYKYDKEGITDLVNHYLKSRENDSNVKKYLVSVCLTTTNHKLRLQVMEKAKRERSHSIGRLVSLIENLSDLKKNSYLKEYLRDEPTYVYYSGTKGSFSITLSHKDLRKELFKELINYYST